MNILIRIRPRGLAALALLGWLAAACGGGSPAQGQPSSQAPAAPASSQAPAAASSSAPATTRAVKFKVGGTGPGYFWSASLMGPITADTTINVGTGTGSAGQSTDAPIGQVYVIARVHIVNTTSQAEPGYTDINGQRPQPLDLVIAMSAASKAGLKIWHFNNQNWTGIGPPPKGPQCGTPQGVSVGGSTYGHYCDLGIATGNLFTLTAQATNEGNGLQPPHIAPGGSQDLTIYVGPLPKSVPLSAVHVIAVAQGPGGNGFTVIG